ncbi:MAG: cyclic pyranopterin monophosphate synthase MoaC [Candidatus Cloacimonetes bacterium]|jgi:cyclic pyranopterin monophosphate synthase|nr:cyclic pyranopterin monophosphate synthase MoaC [Candidatus Cloacimonadota bacterium]MBT6994384.1 cyclic pyranopterin monophosphate synthase MoaC [Candidatus Cloacimonadota bacterium]MBT7468985.1 cyclic pyranopterin monophosphate synthase MoaC [Candidatus Cloacimonadota bacterium]
MKFTHLDENGKATMVDVSAKQKVKRTAIASGKIFLQTETIQMINDNLIKKGDVLTVAKIAAIAGAKRTSDIIPLCHNIAIDQIDVEFTVLENAIAIKSTAICVDKTGIEMEALTAVSIAALTIYDMCKAVDKTMKIGEITLLKKTKEMLN